MKPPPEPRDGQDDAPDLLAALRATVRLLVDVRAELDEEHEDIRLRAGALTNVHRRLIRERE